MSSQGGEKAGESRAETEAGGALSRMARIQAHTGESRKGGAMVKL